MICLGCCIDYQAVARSPHLDEHPDRGLFDALSQEVGRPVHDLRWVCIRHQIQVIEERVAAQDEDTDALTRLRTELVRLLAQLWPEPE